MYIIRLLKGAAFLHRTSDAGLHPVHHHMCDAALQQMAAALHRCIALHIYKHKSMNISKKVGKYAKKRWKMPSFALVNAKAASDAFFASDAKMPLL